MSGVLAAHPEKATDSCRQRTPDSITDHVGAVRNRQFMVPFPSLGATRRINR